MPTIIAPSFLLPQDRIARGPLGSWAGDLRERLQRCVCLSRRAAEVSDQVGTIANNAALIAIQRGASARARHLCERQLFWQARLSRRSRNPLITSSCVQPWVNLARLESFSGEWEFALARLGALRTGGRGGVLALQPLRRDGVGCQQVRGTGPSFAEWLETAYVIDSLRVLLQNRRHAEVIQFAARMAAERRTRLMLWADEAMIIAACREGDVSRAEQVIRTALSRNDAVGWARAVFRLRLAEVLVCAGQAQSAVVILERMAAVMSRLSDPVLRNLQTLYVLMPLASICLAAGLLVQADSLARAVYEGARAAGDEVFEIEALRLRVLTAPESERGGWQRALDSLETTTDYRRYRRSGSASAATTDFDTLDAELEEILTN